MAVGIRLQSQDFKKQNCESSEQKVRRASRSFEVSGKTVLSALDEKRPHLGLKSEKDTRKTARRHEKKSEKGREQKKK